MVGVIHDLIYKRTNFECITTLLCMGRGDVLRNVAICVWHQVWLQGSELAIVI